MVLGPEAVTAVGIKSRPKSEEDIERTVRRAKSSGAVKVCEVPIDLKIEGRSIKQLLLTGNQPAFERPEFYMWLQKTTKQAMQLGDWKIVRDDIKSPVELYNLKSDPFEKTDLASKEPDRVKQMTAALDAHLEAAQLVPWKEPQK